MKASDQTAVEFGRESDPMIGRIIGGKYRIRARVGGGAMGVVYDAKQIALDKRVAIKVLNDDLQQNKHFVARFQVEAKAASLLDHANSTRVFDFGKDDNGLLYICMEFLEGQSLLEVIETQSPLPAARIVDLTAQTLAALARAHDLGILHRDLKPENIMVLKGDDDEGNARDVVKVCDFGIAKFDPRQHLTNSSPPIGGGESDSAELGAKAPSGNWRAGSALTQVGLIIGTPDYMSPEQARGEAVDERSEIYSVGVVLYHLLTGRVPFEGGDVLETLTRHMTLDPAPPSEVRPGVDAELEAICRIAMSKDPAVRYRSARDMRAALRSTAACRRVGGGRAAMFSFVPPARTLAMKANGGGPAWSMVPSVMPPLLDAPSLAPPMAISIGPALAGAMGLALPPMAGAPAMRAMLKKAGPPPLERNLMATVRAPADGDRPSIALTSPAPPPVAALPFTVPAPAVMPSALALAMTMAGVSMTAQELPQVPQVAVKSAPAAKAEKSLPPPALPVARLTLQEAPRRRGPLTVALAAAVTALCLGGALAAFGHSSLAATATPSPVARQVEIGHPANVAPLAVASELAAPTSAGSDSAPAPVAPAPSSAPQSSQATPWPASKAPSALPLTAIRGRKPAGERADEAATSEVPAFQPEKGRVAVIREDSEGFERHLVNELLGHASLERCYVDALKEHGSAATGATLLTLVVDGGKVSATSLSSDLGLQALRPCLETQLVGQPMGDDGTASGSAHVSLQLTDL